MIDELDDIARVTTIVLLERQGRDRGWWEQMGRLFLPDSSVRLSWFQGAGPDFVTASEKMSNRGVQSVHRMSAPAAQVHGDRAYVEAPTAIDVPVVLHDRAAVITSYSRLQYRLERRDGVWGILSLDCLYERDTVTPQIPGTAFEITPDALAGFRSSYALVAYHLATNGQKVRDDLLGDDQPDRVDEFYREVREWLRAAV